MKKNSAVIATAIYIVLFELDVTSVWQCSAQTCDAVTGESVSLITVFIYSPFIDLCPQYQKNVLN